MELARLQLSHLCAGTGTRIGRLLNIDMGDTMCIARKVILICTMAIAAMGLAANSASAQETAVEIDKLDGTDCTLAICKFRAVGESHLTRTSDGVIVSRCRDTFEGAFIHKEGAGRFIGHIYDWVPATHETPGVACNVNPCLMPSEREWRMTNAGETNPNVAHVTMRLCMRVPGDPNDRHCNLEINITEIVTHTYLLATHVPPAPPPTCISGARKVEGGWTQVVDGAHPPIEVDHTPGL